MALQPLNDLGKVRLDTTDPYNFGGSESGDAESGILVEIPAIFNYFGFWSFAFENSWGDAVELAKLRKTYANLIGRRVFWSAGQEKGSVIKTSEGRFAFIKLSSLIAQDEADSEAVNTNSDSGGSFRV